jgi:hypothetical protein
VVPLDGVYKPAAAGSSAHAVLKASLRAPTWWIAWYPRGLRRPGDVWDRLPWRVRRLRLLVTALFAILGTTVLPGLLGLYAGAANVHAAEGTAGVILTNVMLHGLLAAALLCLVLALELPLATHWATRHGLDTRERHRLFLDERTAGSSFWARPQIAALLTPVAFADPRTPTEHVSALQALAVRLEGARRELAQEALGAARLLMAGLHAADEEAARLAAAGDAAGLEKLETQLRALGEPTETGDVRRDLRELLSRQLEATRAVAARLDETRARRRRLDELLTRLWAEVRALEAGAQVSQRMHVLCAEARRESSPMGEAAGSDAPTL